MVATEIDVSSPYLNRLTAPRAVYIDGIWNQEDADKWITIIQAPVEKGIMKRHVLVNGFDHICG